MSSMNRAFFLFVCLVAFALANTSWSDPPARQAGPGDPNKPVLLDQQGDPLPTGAVARMGTVRFRGSGSNITSLAFSPDGKTLASVGRDRDNESLVQLWDAADGKQKLRFKNLSNDVLSNIVFSPDGKVMGLVGRTLHHLRDSGTGKEIDRFKKIPYSISSLVFSPDGTTFVTVGGEDSGDSGVQLWDFATGNLLRSFQWHRGGENNPRKNNPDDLDRATKSIINLLFGGDSFREQVAMFSPDGKTVSAWGFKPENGESRIRIWETHTGKQVRQVTDIPALAGQLWASIHGCPFISCDNNTVRLLDGSSGKELAQVGKPNPAEIASAAIAPDGKTLVLCHADSSTQLLDMATGKVLRELGNNIYASVAFSPDGKSLALADNVSNVIHLLDPATGKDRTTFGGHHGSLNALFLSADGKTLATASQDKTVRLWDVVTGKEVRQFSLASKTDKGLRFAFSRDGKMLATGAKGLIRSWDMASGKELREFSLEEIDITDLAFSPNGQVLAAALQDGSAYLWNADSGKEKFHLQPVKPEKVEDAIEVEMAAPPIRAMSFSPDGKTLAMMTSVSTDLFALDRTSTTGPILSDGVRILEVATGKERRVLKHPEGTRRATPNTRFRVIGNQVVQFSEFESSGPEPLLYSPDGKSLALIQPGVNPIRLNMIDAATGETILHVADRNLKVDDPDRAVGRQGSTSWSSPYSEGAIPSSSAVFSADGRLLAAGSGDGIVRVWETATGRLVCRFIGHQGAITSLVFSADGKMLVSGSDDTTALAWDIARGMKELPPSKEELPKRKSTSRAAATSRSSEKLETFWADLAKEDATKAGIAMQALERSPKDSVQLLKKMLQPTVIVVEPRRIERLISDLDSEQPMTRDKAMEELERLERVAESALRQTLEKNPPSLEARRRIERLLEKLESPFGSPDALRSTRALEVLEHIGSPEARGILEDLARGTPEAELTRDAKEALARWNKRIAAIP